MKVLFEENNHEIKFIDIFQSGYMDRVILDVKKAKKQIANAMKSKKRQSMLDSIVDNVKDEYHVCINPNEMPDDEILAIGLICKILSTFRYYFWSKCEYEVVLKETDRNIFVHAWPDKENCRQLTNEELFELAPVIAEIRPRLKDGVKIDWWDQVKVNKEELVVMTLDRI